MDVWEVQPNTNPRLGSSRPLITELSLLLPKGRRWAEPSGKLPRTLSPVRVSDWVPVRQRTLRQELAAALPAAKSTNPSHLLRGDPTCRGGTLRARGKPTLPAQRPGPFWVVLGSGLTFCWLPEGCQPPSQPTQPNPPCREVGRLPDPGAFQMSPRISNTNERRRETPRVPLP